jgi:cytochrome c553
LALYGLPAAQPADPAQGRLVASGGGGAGAGAACFACHGLDGMGDAGAAFPRLAGLDRRYLAKQLENYADGSRPNAVMTPIALALSAAERRSVAAYYAGLAPASRRAEVTRASVDAALLQRGATLYAVGSQAKGVQACANCHGPDGRGLGGPFPAVGAQPAPYVVHQLRLWREGARTNDQAAMMRVIAARLDDEDIEALGLYLQSLPP